MRTAQQMKAIKLVSRQEVLAKIHLTPRTLTRWGKAGVIPRCVVGIHPSGRGRIGYYPEWVIEYILGIQEMRRDGLMMVEAVLQAQKEWELQFRGRVRE